MSVYKNLNVKAKAHDLTQRFKRNEDGNFATLAALSLTVFIGCLAVGIDIANGQSAQSRLQDTTDAIALLAVRKNLKSQSDLNEAANNYLKAVYTGDMAGSVRIEKIERVGDRVNVRAFNNIDTYFSNIYGKESLDIRAASQAIYDNRGLDLALVLDTTGSMRGAKLASLKTASNSLIKELERQDNDNIRLSVVPFSQYVNVGKSNQNQRWINDKAGKNWKGCVGSRSGNNKFKAPFSGAKFPAVNVTYCPNAMQPLSKSLNKAKSTISSMKASGWTYMPAGLSWGYRTLNSETPFTEAKSTNFGVNKTEKALVLMTDGANTRSVSGDTHDAVNINEANQITEKLCETMKKENIRIYTIAFQLSTSSQSNKARKILENCASTKNSFFDTQSASQLNKAFQEIGQSLVQPRITA